MQKTPLTNAGVYTLATGTPSFQLSSKQLGELVGYIFVFLTIYARHPKATEHEPTNSSDSFSPAARGQRGCSDRSHLSGESRSKATSGPGSHLAVAEAEPPEKTTGNGWCLFVNYFLESNLQKE